MSLCSSCHSEAWWPYAIALFLSSFTAFLTGLTLYAAGVPLHQGAWWIGGAFGIVFALLFRYMKACLERHCGHRQTAAH